MENYFVKLYGIDASKYVEKKNDLSYLSWPYAWAEVKKLYPDADYDVLKFNGLPYVFDEKTGYMVYTTVTIEGITHEMWLPVMDGANKAMLDKPYQYKTRQGIKSVEAATMFDINKTIMRCLVKNLAMHGLGLYIYAGEDLPEISQDAKIVEAPKTKASVIGVVAPEAEISAHVTEATGEVDKAKLCADIKAAFKNATMDVKKAVKQVIVDNGAQALSTDLPEEALKQIAVMLEIE